MTEKKEGWFTSLLKWIISLFEDKPTKSVVKLEQDLKEGKKVKAKDVLTDLADDAKDVVIQEGTKFLLTNGHLIAGMTPEQKEYATHMAYLRAIDKIDALSLDELVELRQLETKIAEMGPAVAEQLNSFWTAFGECVEAIIDKVSDIGIRAGSIALKTVLPVL
jgi:hypothetical protein